MAQEGSRTRAQPVGSRLEHHDQVSHLGARHLHAVRKEVEGRAQRADDGNNFSRRAADAIAHRHRIVLADDLAEIARRRQMVMQAAVGHEETMTAGHLAVDYAADIDARFADEESTELQHHLRLRQARVHALQDGGQITCDERNIEPLVAGKIRNAQAAADVQDAHGAGRVLRETQRELDALSLRFRDRFGAQVLRAAEDVEALEVEPKLTDPAQHGGDTLGVDAERLWAAPHLSAGAFQLEVGVDAHVDARPRVAPARNGGKSLHLPLRFEVDDDAGSESGFELGVGLARAGKADGIGAGAGFEGDLELAGGGDIEPVDEPGEMPYDLGHRVRLHRVMDVDLAREVAAQKLDALADEPPVVGVERRAPDAPRELGQRDPADREAIVQHRELIHRRVDRACGPVHAVASNSPANSCARSLRSILPFGLRGRLPFRSTIRAGTMKAGSRSRHFEDIAARSSPEFAGEVATRTMACPSTGCSMPNAATSPTSPVPYTTSSTSVGLTR